MCPVIKRNKNDNITKKHVLLWICLPLKSVIHSVIFVWTMSLHSMFEASISEVVAYHFSVTQPVWTACWSAQRLLCRSRMEHRKTSFKRVFIIQPQQRLLWRAAIRRWGPKQITWSCPRCTALSCPELFRRAPFGPRCVWWPGQREAGEVGWWWMSPVCAEVHDWRSGSSWKEATQPVSQHRNLHTTQ